MESKDATIRQLRRQVDEEKAYSKRCRDEKIKLEMDLAISDVAIEDLDMELDAQQSAMKELQVKSNSKTTCIVGILSLAIILVGVVVSYMM